MPSRAGSGSRLVLVLLAGLVLVAAAALSMREESLPSWFPETFGALTIRAGDEVELAVTRDKAVAYRRSRLFVPPDPESQPTPETFPVRVTGRVPPEQPAPVSSTGELALREVDKHPAWLVVWRDLDGTVLGGQSVPPGGDVVCIVDGETAVFLTACTFISL